ncbi:MAG TPA: nitroreductase family deazaflavin-dependent oxidoreductase [Acidimicrobiia bacterium]|nr:nitroreductase family deazaflavin-dependent oxidoreductase [Acidimicrobiia bacterium]
MAKEYQVTSGKRMVSSLMGAMAKFGIGNFAVLTTTGRRTSQPRKVTIAPISDEDATYLVSPYGDSGWVLNARANPSATLVMGGSSKTVTLVDVTGSKPDVVKAYYEREVYARQFMDVPGEATVEDFRMVGDRFPVFEIQE